MMVNKVSGPVRLLGYAGLLPQAALLLLILGLHDPTGIVHGMAFFYAALIFSFIGGIWWGFAMRRASGQGVLALLAILPTLGTIVLVAVAVHGSLRWAMVALASAIMLTLPVDRRLAASSEAPTGWMGLRVPLSLGLATLTILAAMV
jgi:hypothetical protein